MQEPEAAVWRVAHHAAGREGGRVGGGQPRDAAAAGVRGGATGRRETRGSDGEWMAVRGGSREKQEE